MSKCNTCKWQIVYYDNREIIGDSCSISVIQPYPLKECHSHKLTDV